MNLKRWMSGAAILTAMCLAPAAAAAELYVAPNGKPAGPGTRAAPYDLLTVLAGKAAVKPGDTVWLLPGTYPAPEGPVPATDDKGQPVPGKTVVKRTAFVSALTGAADKPIILRAMPGGRVMLDGWMEIKGSDAWYWGFEIADSRYTDKTAEGLKKSGTGTGVNVIGPRNKCINLDVHDGAMGFGFWTPSIDSEIYGCIIHDFGYNADDRGHGHAIYTQNETGTKRILDNVMFNGFGWNLHAYGESGIVRGYQVEGNIAFAPGLQVPGQDPPDNYYFSTRNPCDRITFINNVGYHPLDHTRRPNVRMGSDARNGTLVLKDNYIAGMRGLRIANWQDMTVSGNTVWARKTLVQFQADPAKKQPDDKWAVDNNTYIAPADLPGFSGATFDDYRKARGFDQNSKRIDAGRPATNFIFIRPNQYEPGRGHVAVFNWEGKPAAELDLKAVLKAGAKYEIHNVQDLYGQPAAAGTFDGKPVSVPMLKSKIAPDFDAFLVTTLAAK